MQKNKDNTVRRKILKTSKYCRMIRLFGFFFDGFKKEFARNVSTGEIGQILPFALAEVFTLAVLSVYREKCLCRKRDCLQTSPNKILSQMLPLYGF